MLGTTKSPLYTHTSECPIETTYTRTFSLQILDLISVNCTDYQDIKKLEAAILGHVRNEEIFPNVIRMLPPVYKEVEAAIVDIVQSEGTAEHGNHAGTVPSSDSLPSRARPWTPHD